MYLTGLGSILFAIKIDSVELNSIKAAVGLDTIINTAPTASKPFPARLNEEPLPVFAGEGSPGGKQYSGTPLVRPPLFIR